MEFPHTIQSQEEMDRLFNQRLARKKQVWESESGISEARQRAEEAEARAEAAEARARQRIATRDARSQLAEMGVADAARQQRILRLADLEGVTYDDQGEPSAKDIRDALKAVHADVPEVFGEGAQVVDSPADAGTESASGKDVPITSEEQLEKMSDADINSNWDRVAAFIRGER